jgi:hypothetical protein
VDLFNKQHADKVGGFSVTLEGSVKCKMPPKVDLFNKQHAAAISQLTVKQNVARATIFRHVNPSDSSYDSLLFQKIYNFE